MGDEALPTVVRAVAARGVATRARRRVYARHEATATALHGLVRRHLEGFIRLAAERSGRPLPRFVAEEFRAYLRCGVLAHGFARARCASCGHDLMVAFSCKLRGVCPSCGGRRMSATAAHLTDRVLPEVPLRQWVLSVPFALRRVLARDPTALTLVSRTFWEELRRWHRGASHLTPDHAERIEAGAITFVQRFGGSLNLNVHFHVVVADGVWRCPADGRSPRFVATPPPGRDDLALVVTRVVRRLARAFAQRGAAGDGDAAEDDALAGCCRTALARGTYGTALDGGASDAGDEAAERRFGRRPPKAQVAELEGFNLHASVVIGARDPAGRERLLRYVARPAVVNDRVTELPDGRVAYRLKLPGGRGETHRIMEPMEFMARLAALVPPPRHPLVRYHGVFAPNSPWRGAVVPSAPPTQSRVCAAGRVAHDAGAQGASAATASTRPSAAPSGGDAVFVAKEALPAKVTRPSSRIDWATLLHRVWNVDALACTRCGDRMRFIATITDRAVIVRILAHLRLPTDEMVPTPARRWDDTS